MAKQQTLSDKLNNMTDSLANAIVTGATANENKLPYTQNPVGIIKQVLFTNQTDKKDNNYYRYIVTINGQDYNLKMVGTKYDVGDIVPLKASNNNWNNLKQDEVAQKIGKVHVMPTASKDYYDYVFLYLGSSNDDFIQYHNYHCVREKVDNKDVYSWVDITVFSDGDWQPPADWLKLPTPLEHQIVMLVNNKEEIGIQISTLLNTSNSKIEWGDGTVTNVPINSYEIYYHTYTSQGHITKTGGEQFIITISLGYDDLGAEDSFYPYHKMIGFDNDYSGGNSILMVKDNSLNVSKKWTWESCYALKSVEILSNITTLESNAICYNYSLQKIVLPPTINIIKNDALHCNHSLKSITIPNNVTTIGDRAFEGCYSLKSITIPNNVTTIEWETFYDNYSLEEVILPSSITEIKNKAFGYCSSLDKINIPPNCIVTNDAFEYCASLNL